MDTKVLENIGLTSGEAKVYLTLVKIGSSTSGPITDESGVSRSKIYNILDRLLKKGLVSYIIKEKTRYYQAEDPSKLKRYMDKEEEEFKKKRDEIDKLIPKLLEKANKKKTEAQIYYGFKGLQTVYEHAYDVLKKGEEYVSIGIPEYQDEKYHIYWQRDHKKREKLGINCRMLFNKGTDKKILENRNSYCLADARYMPPGIKTPSWFMIYKNIVVIFLQNENGIAIEIINQDIADSFKKYFESFWKLSKNFKN